MDPKAMMKLSYGLFVLTAKTGEKINGCITNTAIQVTTEPNQIAFAVNKANLTHDMVKESGRFVISIISEKAEFSLFKHFGFQSGRNVDKFADFDSYKLTESGIPYITAGINAYLEGEVVSASDLGTHTLFVCKVTDMEVLTEDASATYAYYHANIKPKPQEVKKTEEGKVIWRCTICGYEYEGDPIPDDFICPWCKHPASDFERVVL
jgi:flavin reductase (DIM6/NTAB) family NADH-FMN oxidoreductase RutF/rubredoxin